MKEITFFTCIFVLCGFICLVLGNRCRFMFLPLLLPPYILHPLILTVKHPHTHTPTHTHTRVLILLFDMKMYAMLLWYLTVRNENKNEGKIEDWNKNATHCDWSIFYRQYRCIAIRCPSTEEENDLLKFLCIFYLYDRVQGIHFQIGLLQFIHSYIRQFVHSFIYSSIRSFIHRLIDLCVYVCLHQFFDEQSSKVKYNTIEL